jgi:hypothetical protein
MASYLEIDSTFRNRIRWAEPGEFEVSISASGRALGEQSSDPICISCPVNSFTGGFFDVNTLGNENVEGIILSTGLGYANSKNVIEFRQVAPSKLQHRYNYYKHAIFRNSAQPSQFGRILEYIYLGNGRAQVTLSDDNFQFNFGDTFFIVDPSDVSDPTSIYLFVPAGSNSRQDYINKLIYNETLEEWRPINGYDSQTGILSIGGNVAFGWQRFHNYSIRATTPTFVFQAGMTSTDSQVVITGVAASSKDNMYQSWFLRIPQLIYSNTITSPQGEIRRIIKYDGATTTATVFPPFTSSTTLQNIELMQFGYDNANPLTFKFNPSQEIPVYNIRLKRLILPNKILSIGNGGKTAFQNYFYIELSNIDTSGTNTTNIFSNNPYSYRALFRASANNINNPEDQEFVTLQGDDMTQTVRFRLDDNLKFKVSLGSTGETFRTTIPDNIPPAEPDHNLQVNALFEMVPFN